MDQHCDPEAAALAALGEPLSDDRMNDHVATCASCQREIEALRSTVLVARSTIDEHELQAAPTHVWHSIRAELGLSDDLMPPSRAQASAASTSIDETAGDGLVSETRPAVEPVRLDDARARRAGIRRFIAPILASAAAAALVATAVVTWSAGAPRDAGVTLAAAQLDALPAWSGSSGEATIVEQADGERVIRVALDAPADDSLVREVWLMTESVDGLISLGYLTGSTGEFTIPGSIDLARFSIVDISAEPLDGDPTHSGDSIVRGALDA